jgi:membrane-anchored protein YejM (alkaline phosphatase superfamily)
MSNKIILFRFIKLGLVVFFIIQIIFLYNFLKINTKNHLSTKEMLCNSCNVILISLDTLRAKSLNCYGYEKNTAPNLYEFSKKSFLFHNNYSQYSQTLASHFSLFTSLYPSSHQIITSYIDELSKKIPTLTQILQKNNYDTYFVGITNDYNLPLNKGIERGFDKVISSEDPADWSTIIENLNLSNPFFIFLHTYEVHAPYYPAIENVRKFYLKDIEEINTKVISENVYCQKTYLKILEIENISNKYNKKNLDEINCDDLSEMINDIKLNTKEKSEAYSEIMIRDKFFNQYNNLNKKTKSEFIQALYDAKIYELDKKLEIFFSYIESKGLLNDTVIIITSDHGEAFDEHGHYTHLKLYNEEIKTPLIIYIPKTTGKVINNISQNIDVYPTVLSILNIDIPTHVQGINLFSEKQNNFAISERNNANRFSIITEKYKLIKNNNTTELYDLSVDPNEYNNISSDNPKISTQLNKTLVEFIEKLPKYSQELSIPFPSWINEEQRKNLIDTGYF